MQVSDEPDQRTGRSIIPLSPPDGRGRAFGFTTFPGPEPIWRHEPSPRGRCMLRKGDCARCPRRSPLTSLCQRPPPPHRRRSRPDAGVAAVFGRIRCPRIVGVVESASLLLVDHESGTRRSLQQALTAKGFAVTGVGGVKEALAAAEGTSFAYAAVEIRLGDGDGVALVAQLHEFDPAMRIVVVTGFDSFASVIVALRAGAVDYLPKPIQAGEPANALLGRLFTFGAPHAARRRSCPLGAYPADLRAMRQEQ